MATDCPSRKVPVGAQPCEAPPGQEGIACYTFGSSHLCSICFLDTETAILAQTIDPELVLTRELWQVPSTTEKSTKTS